jgi:hypothetical protein
MPTASLISAISATSPSAVWIEASEAQRDDFIAGESSSLHWRQAAGQMGEQSQAPKQALGVVTLHAICEE